MRRPLADLPQGDHHCLRQCCSIAGHQQLGADMCMCLFCSFDAKAGSALWVHVERVFPSSRKPMCFQEGSGYLRAPIPACFLSRGKGVLRAASPSPRTAGGLALLICSLVSCHRLSSPNGDFPKVCQTLWLTSYGLAPKEVQIF